MKINRSEKRENSVKLTAGTLSYKTGKRNISAGTFHHFTGLHFDTGSESPSPLGLEIELSSL